MKQGPSKFRRAVTACAAGTIALSFLSVLALTSPASALPAGTAVGSTIAASAPTLRPNLANQAAGNLTVTLVPGATGNGGTCAGGGAAEIQLALTDFGTVLLPEAASINWDHVPTITQTPTVGNTGFKICTGATGDVEPAPSATGSPTLTFFYQVGAATTVNQPIVISNISYDVLGAVSGPVVVGRVAPSFDTDSGYGAASATANNITPNSTSLDGFGNPYDPSASNAAISTANFGTTLYATTTPVIGPGTNAAGAWELPLTGPANSWASGDKIYITVARSNPAVNCETAGTPDSVGFSGVPLVTAVAAFNGATTTPTLTASLAQMGSCSTFSGVNNVLVLTFTNSGTIGSGTATDAFGQTYAAEITIAGVSYAVSGDVNTTGLGASNQGPVTVLEGYNTPPTFGPSGLAAAVPTNNDLLTWVTSLTAMAPAASVALAVTPLPVAVPTGTSIVLGAPLAETVLTTAPAVKGAVALAVGATTNAHAVGTPISILLPFGNNTAANCPTCSGESNANINVFSLKVVANTPSVTLQTNFTSSGSSVTNGAISPITITEGSPGALGGGVTGYECVEIFNVAGQQANWNATTSTPTATLGGGFTAGTVPVTVETTGTQTGPGTLEFQIPTASTGTAGTVTLSGLAVDVSDNKGVLPNLQGNLFFQGVNAACGGATEYSGGIPPSNNFTLANFAVRSFGQVQDDTAGGLLQTLPPICTNGVPQNPAVETAAVLVTNGSYQDALSASYLAGQLGTGVLTTLTNTVSTGALNALRVAGVTQVFVVGGPLVVSPADITQLQNTPSYNCGGLSQRTTLNGQPVDLVVQQIYGQTADATAAAVATFAGVNKPPGKAQFQAAYNGAYNDTTGSNGSAYATAPDHQVTTAVVATDQSFQDAASASAIAYNSHFPLVLTPQGSLGPDAAGALVNDAVQQVIVMGGPVAISDNVVTQIEALGISVLRMAGQDFTDTSQLLAQFELNSVVPLLQPNAGQAFGLDASVNVSALGGSGPGYGPLNGGLGTGFPGSAGPGYLIIARGDYYTDAIVASLPSGGLFVGAAHPSGPHSPILLVWDPNNEGNPSGTNYLGKFLTGAGQGYGQDLGTPTDGTINDLFIVGGPFAVSNALETTLGTSLNG